MAFRILSWNIETFGEKKLGGIENFVARVIQHYNADAAFILEGTMHGAGQVAAGLARELEELTGHEWFPFGSSPTGKSLFLPQTVKLPSYCELGIYQPKMLVCYTETAKGQFQLKPGPFNPGDVLATRELLESNGVLRRDVETYMGVFRFDSNMYRQYRVNVALGSWVTVSPLRPGGVVSADAQGGEIGYADPNSEFNGRRPYLANFYFAQPNSPTQAEKTFPVACFHAPFSPDLKVRMRANVGLLRLATPMPGLAAPIPLPQQQAAVVCGDFNVDYDWNEDFTQLTLPVPNTKSLNAQNYGSFYAAGMRMTIGALTSLKKVDSKLEPVTNPLEFRANAYDNLIVRAPVGSPITGAAGSVIDLVSDVYAAQWGSYLAGAPGMPTAPNLFDAFRYVRTKVSDHLPVLCELQVPGRP